MYLYGGCGENGLISNDLWKLSIETRTWSTVHFYRLCHVQIRFMTPLPTLYGHCCVYYKKTMLIFGGDGFNRRMPLSTWNTDLFVASVDLEKQTCHLTLFLSCSRYDPSRPVLISFE